MPDIPLLEPTILRGVVEKFTAPESLTMLSRIPTTPSPYPTVTWDVLQGSRNIATPNVPNSEAHIVPRLGRSQESASFIYLREKKVFEPTTLHWLRTPGTLAARSAEQAVMREVTDLNTRFDNFAEWSIWQMLTGRLQVSNPFTAVDIDYKLPASHKVSPGTNWKTATPQQITADIRAWKKLVDRDGRVPAKDAWTTDTVVQYIFDSFATTGNAAGNFFGGALLSDRMKDQYYTQGILPNFMGLNWQLQDAVFDATGSSYTETPTTPAQEQRFLAEGAIILGNLDANRPMEMFIGPTADDEAPPYFTGKFSKTWKEKDPSARQFLLEWTLLPVITRPEQIVYAANVAP